MKAYLIGIQMYTHTPAHKCFNASPQHEPPLPSSLFPLHSLERNTSLQPAQTEKALRGSTQGSGLVLLYPGDSPRCFSSSHNHFYHLYLKSNLLLLETLFTIVKPFFFHVLTVHISQSKPRTWCS